jgi:TonB family protein
VSLSGRPFDITSHNGALWVCGTDELIASSADEGNTWQTKHRQVDGEDLIHIEFIAEKVAYAAGSNGLVLWTKDGGETWKSIRGDDDLPRLISFGDDQHGIRSTHSGLALTKDGGASWQRITPVKSREELRRFPYVGGVAALDSDHLLILLMEGPFSGWRFFTTADGGKSWNVIEIPSTGLRTLVVRHGEYWAFGHEVIEKDKPGGGYGVALVLHSRDGEHWVHGVRSPKEYTECNLQGCPIWDGAVVDVFGDKPLFTVAPPGSILTNTWAVAGGAICSVNTDLKCAAAKQSEALPVRPPENGRGWRSAMPFHEPDEPGCIHCSYDFMLALSSRAKPVGPIKVQVRFTVSKNGTVREVSISRAPNASFERALAETAKSWVFAPVVRNGSHVEKHREIEITFQTGPIGVVIPAPRR